MFINHAVMLGWGESSGLGGMFGNLFSSRGDDTGDGVQVAQGGVQAGQTHASMLSTASTIGGMGSGLLESLGGWGGVASTALSAFAECGVSTNPVGIASMPANAFNHAPHFAQGTANTSGIPAVLHPNEAVISLSKGRKIPVNMGDAAGGRQRHKLRPHIQYFGC